jgi:hypothetical protein
MNMPWDNPEWPRDEFGNPKRVYQMGFKELDKAQAIVQASRENK